MHRPQGPESLLATGDADEYADAGLPDVWIDPNGDRGYARAGQLQQEFEAAADHLREVDGYVDPADPGQHRQLRADLALEGGGVKGIGLAGAVLALDKAGYSFARVAGTSAGSIAACLIASISKAGKPMTALRTYLGQLEFAKFMPEGKIHQFFDRQGGAVQKADDAAILTHRIGLYPGTYLAQWLQPILGELGVHTFADLKIDQSDDPGMSLPPDRRYRLVIHASDITRGELVQLPWDYAYYGLPPATSLWLVPSARPCRSRSSSSQSRSRPTKPASTWRCQTAV